MEPESAFERLRGEMAGLAESLRGARIQQFSAQAADLERRLPELLDQARAGSVQGREEAAAGLRDDIVRLAPLLETVAVYGRARLALDPMQSEAYGPSGSARPSHQRVRRQEA